MRRRIRQEWRDFCAKHSLDHVDIPLFGYEHMISVSVGDAYTYGSEIVFVYFDPRDPTGLYVSLFRRSALGIFVEIFEDKLLEECWDTVVGAMLEGEIE